MSYQAPIAYSRREAPTRSLRSVEYDLLAQITRRLRSAWANRIDDFPGLVRALADNQQLWSTLASDVALPGNALPAVLRARLFYLYEFTVQHSRNVLDGKASVEVLADINTAVMRGLRGDGGGA
ncbi:flagellar biosynthesis regulator FlaF [Tabrizicola aquatica]|jgi:flagellar protein FlaF|uniref:flagellar biosynthesis regulator FlaF n=1 Tax=Tabrizicola aquatica TaxID=909926 RepID=UPI000CD30EE5|nr:flagellar biosynthesis regulator FlaF [Tabrizicola aquatica]